MAQDDYDYPEDEFDVLGRDRTPQAVHRAPRPWWRVWGPLIAVVVIAPLVAYGLVELATRDGADPAPTSSSSASQEASEGETTEPPAEGEGDGEATEPPAEGEGEGEPTEEPTTEEPPPPPPLDQGVEVRVLNGAAISGLAGRVGDQVGGAGWTTVVPGNYTSPQPEISTIFYNNADLLDEAQAIGELLGIGNVVELADVPAITVVLRPDFSE